MKNKRLHILSTKIINPALLEAAGDHTTQIDCIPFIKIQSVSSDKLAERLDTVPVTGQHIIFTSTQAVLAVAAALPVSPQWRVFCIGGATQKQVAKLFPDSVIIASAPTGAQLATHILSQKPDNLVFFCGNLRLQTIPEIMLQQNIPCREIIVYTTVPTPHKIERVYDGILFFSPSGVESFFSVNTIGKNIKTYSLGPSTTNALQKHTTNIIESATPDIEQMLAMVVNR